MKRRIYLSGRMTGVRPIIWWSRFFGAEMGWRQMGYDVVNPADTIISRHPWLYRIIGYRLTLWYDLRLLRRCHYIYMVDNEWPLSRGARLERIKAHQWGITEINSLVTL